MPGDSILDLDTQLTCIAARISGGQKASSNARRRKDWRAFNVICTIVRKQSSGQARLEHPERNLSQIAKKILGVDAWDTVEQADGEPSESGKVN